MTARSESPKVLFVYPIFSQNSFWNYKAVCEMAGAKYSSIPLGLITVAALLPNDWQMRLINLNTEELNSSDLEWADIVMIGSMLPQQVDAIRLINLAHEFNKPVLVGGPDVTCSPDVYELADFRVVGEAEGVIDEFVAAWRAGAAKGIFKASDFPDITKSPIPRFDLLKIDQYLSVGVQFSRGCPFGCEFCNVIEINGRKPRTKNVDQILGELNALYSIGYRGWVDFVDDNFIGSITAVKPFLKELARWIKDHNYPFEFSTELSINAADDDELLDLLRKANFYACFVGIETPNKEALKQSHKLQNASRDIATSINKIIKAGIFVNAGFIIGFDSEKEKIAEAMIECIEKSAIPVCMVGLLYALPNTQLFRRLQAAGRLHEGSDIAGADDADQCTSGLNFVTLRPRQEALEDFRTVLHSIYAPQSFFNRVSRTVKDLDLGEHKLRMPIKAIVRNLRAFSKVVWRLGVLDRESRWHWWKTFVYCLFSNPRAVTVAASFGALYLHFKPFARFMDNQIAERIAKEVSEEASQNVLKPAAEMSS